MSDLRGLIRAADSRLRDQTRLAPASELIAEGRRRIRRRRSNAGVAAVAIVAVIVGTLVAPVWRSAPRGDDPASPVRLHTRIVLGNGALILDPPGSERPRVSEAAARAIVQRVTTESLGGIGEPQRLVLARVTAHIPPAARPGGVPNAWRLAWVEIYKAHVRVAGCGPGRIPAASTGPTANSARPVAPESVLIIDAITGAATRYEAGVTPCEPEPPTLLVAYEAFSVAFDVETDGTILIHVPPCGQVRTYGFSGGQGSGVAFGTVALVPVGPCAAVPTTQRVKPPAHPKSWEPIRHAPVGPVSGLGDPVSPYPGPTR